VLLGLQHSKAVLRHACYYVASCLVCSNANNNNSQKYAVCSRTSGCMYHYDRSLLI